MAAEEAAAASSAGNLLNRQQDTKIICPEKKGRKKITQEESMEKGRLEWRKKRGQSSAGQSTTFKV